LFLAVAAAQQESRLFGSWQTKDSADSAVVIRLTLNPDGTGTLDNTRIKYSVRGAQLIVNEEGTINNYAFKLNGDEMVVSGGDLDAPLTFVRQGTGKGLGGRKSQPAAGKRSETPQKETGLFGRWQSSEATVQIKADGTLDLNGTSYRYSVKGNTITLSSSEGSAQFPFQLSGDTLQVLVDGRTVLYRRVTGERAENLGAENFDAAGEEIRRICSVSGATCQTLTRAVAGECPIVALRFTETVPMSTTVKRPPPGR